jgi:hypothetical protein
MYLDKCKYQFFPLGSVLHRFLMQEGEHLLGLMFALLRELAVPPSRAFQVRCGHQNLAASQLCLQTSNPSACGTMHWNHSNHSQYTVFSVPLDMWLPPDTAFTHRTREPGAQHVHDTGWTVRDNVGASQLCLDTLKPSACPTTHSGYHIPNIAIQGVGYMEMRAPPTYAPSPYACPKTSSRYYTPNIHNTMHQATSYTMHGKQNLAA